LSCSDTGDNKKIESIIPPDEKMAKIYKEAVEEFNDGQVYLAAKKFLEAERAYPQSDWAAKSAVMASYSYYLINFYSDAIQVAERYIKTYPKDKFIPYAHYIIAMCYFEQILDEKKDLGPLLMSQQKLLFIYENFPRTDYALDASYKLELINDQLAKKEMYIGRYYMKTEKWIAAINRFKTVVKKYDTSVYVEEALHRLVEIYYRIGLIEEAKKTAAVLGYNYQSSRWYKRSYKLFNKEYAEIEKQMKKKKKTSLIKEKIKGLFE
jgi:outer membrane protein assembly factor BamD